MNHNIKKLIGLLKKNNYLQYGSWKELGAILFNINYDLLSDFTDFTDGLPKDDAEPKICDLIWTEELKDIQKSHISCLVELVKRDNFGGYIKYLAEYVATSYDDVEKNKHCSVPDSIMKKMICELFNEQYICTEKSWFHFSSHRWRKCEQKYVEQEILVILIKIFCELSKNHNIHYKIWSLKIYSNLQTTFFKRHYYIEIFDTNTELLGFNNGVYDLKNKLFRIGYPSDYIFRTVDYDYIEYDHNHSKIKEFYDFLKPVKDGESRYKYFEYAYSCLTGKFKSIDVWHGKFGKTTMAMMLSSLLGSYVKIYNNISKIYRNRHAGCIEGETSGCRLVISEDNEGVNKYFLRDFVRGYSLNENMSDFNQTCWLNNKLDKEYYEKLYADCPYGKYVYDGDEDKSYLTGRELFGSARIIPVNHNVLLIDGNPQYDMSDYKATNFGAEFEIDSNRYDRVHEHRDIFMWILLSGHYKLQKSTERDIENICNLIERIQFN